MQDTPSNPQEGTGNLSQSDAVNLLLDTNSPSEEVSEVQPTTEVEAEDVEAVEEQPTEAEAEETDHRLQRCSWKKILLMRSKQKQKAERLANAELLRSCAPNTPKMMPERPRDSPESPKY